MRPRYSPSSLTIAAPFFHPSIDHYLRSNLRGREIKLVPAKREGNEEVNLSKEELARLARIHDVIAVRVVDPLEEELPAAGLVRLAPIAGGRLRELDASAESVRSRWRDEATERREKVEELLARARVDLFSIPTVGDLGEPVQEFFRRRQNRVGGRTC